MIPCLLLHGDSLVKTTRFSHPTYVGDPVNVVSIFNALEADEIMILDIRATIERRKPPFELLAQIAEECSVPLTYGGGLSTLEDVRQVLHIGCERVALNTALDTAPDVMRRAADAFGTQAVVASIDAVRRGPVGYQVVVEGGTRPIEADPIAYARRAEALGAGEVLLTSIDRDGTMEGYDVELVRSVTESVNIPVVACGGAGSLGHLAEAVGGAGAAAVAAGSLWVFQGPSRAVLINYPGRQQRARLFS